MTLLDKSRARATPKYDGEFYIVATEGVRAEFFYFNALNLLIKKRFRSKYDVIDLAKGAVGTSSPAGRFADLERRILEIDSEVRSRSEYYLVCDRDRWTQRELSLVAKECLQKGYNFILSNPCYEVWILFHFIDKGDIDALINERRQAVGKNQVLKLEANRFSPLYSTDKVDIRDLLLNLEVASRRAKESDNATARWPNSTSSRLYILLDKLKPLMEKY